MPTGRMNAPSRICREPVIPAAPQPLSLLYDSVYAPAQANSARRDGGKMHRSFAAGMGILLLLTAPVVGAEAPKRGGTLTFMIPADAPPSFDGHREGTFATIHAVAPFYSVLIRVNPENPASTTDFVCDVCTEIPEPADGGRTYPFTIRDDVRFQDGST